MNKSLPLHRLSQWQQTAFCAALLERMLPNYQMFSEATSFGQYKVLRNQLDLIWQWLDKNNRCKINYDAQLLKLEEQIPDPEAFDFFGVFPALDVCMSLMSLFQNMQDKDSDGFKNVARLSQNSVSAYVELMLTENISPESNEDISLDDIEQHPLMQWESEIQQEAYNMLLDSAENKNTCIQLKKMVLEEGLTNLGIEII